MSCHDDAETKIVDPTGGKIGGIYNGACRGNSCYEAMVHTAFCNAMRSEFGHDEAADASTVAAFGYARSVYGYQSLDEQRASQASDWEEGVCSHGLDVMTCPCGCFEGD
ncbi:hypothetical protein RYA05_04750 [Pseudomonas syringae pv. actinidiae]|nr:hypothetical protein [Pseudomonas syringae pv. actinidiae]